MGKNKNIFITSTGTNIGKTYCNVEILKEMLHRKVLFNAYKPILSGFHTSNIKAVSYTHLTLPTICSV